MPLQKDEQTREADERNGRADRDEHPVHGGPARMRGTKRQAQQERDAGKCLVLSVDLDKSDLTFRTAFPIMVTNALGWFRGGAGELRSSLATGEITTYAPAVDERSATSNLILRSPSGREFLLASTPRPDLVRDRERIIEPEAPKETSTPSAAASATRPDAASRENSLGPFDECGVWTLVSQGSPEQETIATEFAVNLANERESDLRPSAELLSDKAAVPVAAGWFARPLWFYIAACACAITVTEWLLYQRRVIT